MHVNLHAVMRDEDAASDPDALDAQVVSIPRRGQVQLSPYLVGDLVDPPSGLVDSELVFTPNYHGSA